MKWTLTQKIANQFLKFIFIWIKQDVEQKVIKRKFWIFEKNFDWKKNYKINFNSKRYKPIFLNPTQLDRTKKFPQSYEAKFLNI